MVVEDLERYFHTKIEVHNPKLLNCTFNGEFIKPDLKNVLDALAFTMVLEVDQNGSTRVEGRCLPL